MATYAISWPEVLERLDVLADAYLDAPYDALCYVVRGGMAPAHRLAHRLGLAAEQLHALTITRHAHDGVQAAAHAPRRTASPLRLPEGAHVLLVEDTIGAGATLREAIAAIAPFRPRRLDVLTVGLDHADLTRAEQAIAAWPIDRLLVGIDYWGWLVLPWENTVPSQALPDTPLQLDADEQTFDDRLARDTTRVHGLEPEPIVLETAVHLCGALPSRQPASAFLRRLEQLRSQLPLGGRLSFGVLDRAAIRREADLVGGREYYDERLLAAIAARSGYARGESSVVGRLRFECWTASAR